MALALPHSPSGISGVSMALESCRRGLPFVTPCGSSRTPLPNSSIKCAGGTRLFWGVSRSCPGFGVTGCVMALANETTQTSARVAGGTSGIVIDNNYVTLTGGSSIYFTASSANTAYKMTQQGLQ